MALELLVEKGTPIDQQRFTWKEIVGKPHSKLDDDAFTRIRILLMSAIEAEQNRFLHAFARVDPEFRPALAQIRCIEQLQQATVSWLMPADLSPLETSLALEQALIEVGAGIAQQEPDPTLARLFRYGMLEHFDHLYRFVALMDRVEGRDGNAILQGYTDIRPGRPTSEQHRSFEDVLHSPYSRVEAVPISKLHAYTLLAVEDRARDYYMTVGPHFADPTARQLYVEIAAIEEQHVSQCESVIDPDETWLEKWLLHEANEVYNYLGCAEQESNPRIKAIWGRFLDYELGHLHHVLELFRKHDRRNPEEILPKKLPESIDFRSHRKFVHETLASEVDLRAQGTRFIAKLEEDAASSSQFYRSQLNSEGSPSESVALNYRWCSGTELAAGAKGPLKIVN